MTKANVLNAHGVSPRERYMNDPAYALLVTVLVRELKDCHYTPTELREAVILAAIIVQEEQPIPIVVEKWLYGLSIKDE